MPTRRDYNWTKRKTGINSVNLGEEQAAHSDKEVANPIYFIPTSGLNDWLHGLQTLVKEAQA